MNWFGKQRPSKLVKKTIELLNTFDTNFDINEFDCLREIDKSFAKIIEILYKKKEGEEASKRALELVQEIANSEFITLGLKLLIAFPVDIRKQFTNIFTGSITYQTGKVCPIANYITKNPAVLEKLIGFYDQTELAVNSGEMLRLCARHKSLAAILLKPENLDTLFRYFTISNFDISAETFATFRELILFSPQAEEFLSDNSSDIIKRLHATLDQSKYAACRQTLKLICEIIDNSPSFRSKYLNDENNLMLIMNLMLSGYKHISMESFHIFKFFVASDSKPPAINKILVANKTNLIKLIKQLLDGVDDIESQREKDYLIMELGMLRAEGKS